MSTIQQILSQATGGLNAGQTVVANASRNIANVNTPGYAHEIVPLSAQYGGLGVLAGTPVAIRSALLERSLATTQGRLGFHQSQLTHLSAAEQATNDLDGIGIGPSLRDFEQALSAASANPSSLNERTQVLQSANLLGSTFASTRTQLVEARDGAAATAQAVATSVNAITSEIAALNGRIRSARPGDESNSLISRRSDLISQLSGMVGIDVLSRGDGTVHISTTGGRPLVESTFPTAIQVVVAQPPQQQMSFSFVRSDGQVLEGKTALGGELGGLMESYNESLAPAVKRLDEIAYHMMEAFNIQHQSGYNLNGGTGFSFFELPASVDGAAGLMNLSNDVAGHPENVAGALDPTGVPGDNANFQLLTDLFAQSGVLPDGSSVNLAWEKLGSDVTTAYLRATSGATLEQSSVDQLQNLLASETGVSIDEELQRIAAANTAIDAASTVIQSVQEMTTTILNLVQ